MQKNTWNHQPSQKSKAIIIKKIKTKQNQKTRVTKLFDFKIYSKAITTQTVWYVHKFRHGNQWSRIEAPEINSQICRELTFNKAFKKNWWKRCLFRRLKPNTYNLTPKVFKVLKLRNR